MFRAARQGKVTILPEVLTTTWRRLQRENLSRVFLLAAGLLFIGAAGVAAAENGSHGTIQSFGDALWYALATVATVGYGDRVPTTLAGRIIGSVLIVGGVTLFSVLTATVASALVSHRIKEDRGLESLKTKDHLLVCGWNPGAEHVLEATIAARRVGAVALVNELPEESIAELLARRAAQEIRFVRGDPTTEATLERANAKEATAAVVLADATRGAASDDRATLVTLALKSLKRDLRVTVEAVDINSEPHLRRAGADEVVITGEFNGFLLASSALAPGVSEVARPLLSSSGSELRRLNIPPEYVGRGYGELAGALRARDGFLAIAVVHETPGLTLDQLLADDTSMVDQFIKLQLREAGREFLRFEGEAPRVFLNPPDDYP